MSEKLANILLFSLAEQAKLSQTSTHCNYGAIIVNGEKANTSLSRKRKTNHALGHAWQRNTQTNMETSRTVKEFYLADFAPNIANMF
jgi:hypothetical protein